MTQDTKAPEQIWLCDEREIGGEVWPVFEEPSYMGRYIHEYVRADRIEQLAATNEELSNCVAVLEADLRKMALDCIAAEGQATEAYRAQLAAEAKLSKSEALLDKAVEALEKVQVFVRDLEPYADQGHTLVPALHDACMTLIELKGEDR